MGVKVRDHMRRVTCSLCRVPLADDRVLIGAFFLFFCNPMPSIHDSRGPFRREEGGVRRLPSGPGPTGVLFPPPSTCSRLSPLRPPPWSTTGSERTNTVAWEAASAVVLAWLVHLAHLRTLTRRRSVYFKTGCGLFGGLFKFIPDTPSPPAITHHVLPILISSSRSVLDAGAPIPRCVHLPTAPPAPIDCGGAAGCAGRARGARVCLDSGLVFGPFLTDSSFFRRELLVPTVEQPHRTTYPACQVL